MARIVKRTKTAPYQLKPEDKDKTLCQCGLSQNQPFCDNSHLLTQGEEQGKTYWYDDAGERHLLSIEPPEGIRTF